MKLQMQWSYLFKHWFATLLIAPFLSDLFFYVNPSNAKIGGLLSGYFTVFFYEFYLFVTNLYHLCSYFLLPK